MIWKSLALAVLLVRRVRRPRRPSAAPSSMPRRCSPRARAITSRAGSSVRTDTGSASPSASATSSTRSLPGAIELEWTSNDYRATIQPGSGNGNAAATLNGNIDTGTVRFLGTYNFLDRPLHALRYGRRRLELRRHQHPLGAAAERVLVLPVGRPGLHRGHRRRTPRPASATTPAPACATTGAPTTSCGDW